MAMDVKPLLMRAFLILLATSKLRMTRLVKTVQTFNSCTSRPYVCQCQCVVVKHPKNMQSTSMAHVACDSKLSSFLRLSMRP